jgi:DNA-binding GntR family transcriptional regulator
MDPRSYRITAVLTVRPVRRLTLAEDAYESVKSLIMDHLLAPGDRVSIDGLARQLDVSPTPVREALARLESEGLLHRRAMAGYTVTPLLTRKQFDELFELRLLLEVPAAGLAAGPAATATGPAATATATEPGLRPADAALPDAPITGGYASYAAFTAADARFHDRIAAASGNTMLREAFGRLHVHLHLHRLHFPPSHVGVSGEEHARIVAAILARDEGGARAAMHTHLVAARDRHLPFFGA